MHAGNGAVVCFLLRVVRSLATRRDQGSSFFRRPLKRFFFSDVRSHVKNRRRRRSIASFSLFRSSSCSPSFFPQQMADDESRSGHNRRLQTWPFRRRHPAYNETANATTDHRWHDASELDLTRHESFSTIFVTDSSKTLDVRQRTISDDLSSASIHMG